MGCAKAKPIAVSPMVDFAPLNPPYIFDGRDECEDTA
jgi:hypothetical protein